MAVIMDAVEGVRDAATEGAFERPPTDAAYSW